MGNSPSSQSIHSPTSIRSRSSRKNRESIDQQTARVSHAVSFYQTPPGSFDPDRPLSFAPPTEPPQSESSRSPSPEPSPVRQRAPTPAFPSTPTVSAPTQAPEEPVKRKWRPGVYSLVNAKSSTVADLHGGDRRTLIGYPSHGGKNQQWNFEPLGDGYSIRNVLSGTYLTPEDGVFGGSLIVATPFPVSWQVERVKEEDQVTIRLLWPNGRWAIELADLGSAVAGTKIQLASSNADDISQQWQLVEHDMPPPTPVTPSRAPAPSQKHENIGTSPPVETIVVSEDRDYVTTTRTTTTSTVTTVTTVTKTPRTV